MGTGWTAGVRFSVGAPAFSLLHTFGTALGSTYPLVQWVPEAISLGLKRSIREGDYLPPSSAEVKNGDTIIPLSHKCLIN
jgi:hypothetical protein